MTTSTEYTATPPQPPPPPTPVPPRPPLRRSQSDKVIAGVAGGLGHWLGIDPVIIRVVFVVLAVFGGAGLALYVIGWLFIPVEGSDRSGADDFLRDANKPGTTARTILVIIGIVVAVSLVLNLIGWAFGDWSGLGTILVLALIGGLVLYLVNRQEDTAVLAAGTSPPPAPPVVGFVQPAYVAPPATPQETSYLGLITLCIAVIATGVLISLEVTGVTDLPAVAIPAVALAILGAGILAGAWVGRARWLLWFAIPLLLVTMAAAAVPSNLDTLSADIRGGVGDRSWTPVTVEEASAGYALGVGSAELDLRALIIPEGVTSVPVTASVGMGELVVLVPDDARVLVDADVRLGGLVIDGVPVVNDPSPSFTGTLPGNPELGPVIDLTLTTDLGSLEVSRA